MPTAVTTRTALAAHSVGPRFQVRNPYTRVRLAQMRWNGIVSQPGNMNMKSRLTRAKIHHATSIARGGYGHQKRGSLWVASARHELITLTPHRLDQLEAELGAEPAHAHVDHV